MTEAERVAIWKAKNPEKHKAQQQRYREKHREEERYKEANRIRGKRYYWAHRDEILEKYRMKYKQRSGADA